MSDERWVCKDCSEEGEGPPPFSHPRAEWPDGDAVECGPCIALPKPTPPAHEPDALEAIRSDVKRWADPLHNAYVLGEMAIAHVNTLLAHVDRLTRELEVLRIERDQADRSAVGWKKAVEIADDQEARARSENADLRRRLAYDGPERRKADEPWKIPARVGKLVCLHNEGAWGTWEWLSDQVLFSPFAYRMLMGRRRTDWSESHG